MQLYWKDIEEITKLDLPWSLLSGKNILITGATGLIGGCLVETLMSNPNIDYHIFASGRNEERARRRFSRYENDAHYHFIKYDVTEKLESDLTFDYIIFAASNASPNFFAKTPVEIIKSNIEGVVNTVEYGLCHGMRRFLYISTGEVYGEGDGRVFTEEYSGYVNPLNPRSCYPSSKRAAETLCASYSVEYGADVVIARPCHTFGPFFTESDNRVYAQFIRNIRNGEDIVLKSKGTQYRSWCYVVDCACALLYILLKGKNGEAYNIADPNANITIRELAEMIAKIGNKKVVFDMPTEEESKGYNQVKQSLYSIEKISQLGWSIKGSMYEKMQKTLKAVSECKD
ncbi:MAG: NAD-dependent epimerase/dehydratase family protein [Prevotella sp.]|nr:NAD-dependent epimerase/dehydratase family protein [Prevotella sp.]